MREKDVLDGTVDSCRFVLCAQGVGDAHWGKECVSGIVGGGRLCGFECSGGRGADGDGTKNTNVMIELGIYTRYKGKHITKPVR
jgi:hypothetical protein